MDCTRGSGAIKFGALMSTLDKITEACRFLLNNSPEAQSYLDYINGRLSPKMQEEFSFGYFPGAQNLSLLTSFVSEEELKGENLLTEYTMRDSVSARIIYHCFFEDHPLVLPYRDVYGNILALVGRTLLDDATRSNLPEPISKYKNTKFPKGNHVFGLYEAKTSILEKDCVYVVEGQFDVIKAREKGIHNIVALGNSNMTAYQLSLTCRYTKNIFLLLDSDAAGEKGREMAIKKYSQVCNLSSIYLPFGYKDIDEYLKNHDGDSLTFVVKNAKYNL